MPVAATERQIFQLELEELPPSVGRAYPTNRNGRRYLSDVGKEFKTRVGWACKAEGLDIPAKTPLSVHLIFYFPQNRINKKIDIENLQKLLIDALMEASATPADDKWIWQLHAYKRLGESARTVVRIEVLS